MPIWSGVFNMKNMMSITKACKKAQSEVTKIDGKGLYTFQELCDDGNQKIWSPRTFESYDQAVGTRKEVLISRALFNLGFENLDSFDFGHIHDLGGKWQDHVKRIFLSKMG